MTNLKQKRDELAENFSMIGQARYKAGFDAGVKAALESEAVRGLVEANGFYAANRGLRINHTTNMLESCDSEDKIDFHGSKAREALKKFEKFKKEVGE